MIKALFWDNDGILVDTEKLYYKANKIIFSGIGIDLTVDMYIKYFLISSKGTWHLAAQNGISDNEISELRKERNYLYGRLLETELKVIDGVEETLQKLFGKFIMGIVTSSQRNHFEIIHSKTGLLKYFDFTLTSDDFASPKPDPGPYLKALEITGFKNDECFAIEDSQRGLKSALRANLKCYVIPTALTKSCDFTGAGKILNSVKELSRELIH